MNAENDKLPTDDEKGAAMVEYALLAALIAVVCITVLTVVGQNASNAFSKVADALNDSTPQTP